MTRCDFAYAGRDTVNQLGKVAPGIIKHSSLEINNVVQQRINQIISQDWGRRGSGEEIKTVPRKILRGAIKDEYQTPFAC